MNDIQTVTIYYRVVYTIAALVLAAYSAGIIRAARRARERLEGAKRKS